MAHAIWTGSINFGLVTIPVKLFPAVREHDIHFNQLHAKDKGRIQYKRVCSVDGKEVPWEDIVKGYEYEKDHYVILDDEDLKSVAVEATQSVDIVQFVNLSEINPMHFDKPYYLEPEKKGHHAYALLREALRKSGKVGVAKVVIRTKEYLAVLKPQGDALILELMRFADEIVPTEDFKFPEMSEKVPAPELKMANMLIDSMTAAFNAGDYKDEYVEAVMKMIEDRARGKAAKKAVRRAAKPATSVSDIVDVLQQSLRASGSRRGAGNGARTTSKNGAARKREKVRR